MFIGQRIEDQDCIRTLKGTSSAKSLTASFWVKSNKTGTYILELYDSHNARQIEKSYTIDSANTWEYKTITFAGDTTGAFANDNGIGFMLQFWLAAGSNYTSGTLSTSWAAGTAANRAVGQLNLADSTDNEWLLTGVQLEIGEKATEFEHEPFETTLAKCQRYFCRTYAYGTATGAADNSLGAVMNSIEGSQTYASAGNFNFPVEMRAAPTVTLYSTYNADTTGKVTADATDGTGAIFGIASSRCFIIRNNDSTGTGANVFMRAHALAEAEI